MFRVSRWSLNFEAPHKIELFLLLPFWGWTLNSRPEPKE
jgi:hypothetical protein